MVSYYSLLVSYGISYLWSLIGLWTSLLFFSFLASLLRHSLLVSFNLYCSTLFLFIDQPLMVFPCYLLISQLWPLLYLLDRSQRSFYFSFSLYMFCFPSSSGISLSYFPRLHLLSSYKTPLLHQLTLFGLLSIIRRIYRCLLVLCYGWCQSNLIHSWFYRFSVFPFQLIVKPSHFSWSQSISPSNEVDLSHSPYTNFCTYGRVNRDCRIIVWRKTYIGQKYKA